jgi:hypothetical protein
MHKALDSMLVIVGAIMIALSIYSIDIKRAVKPVPCNLQCIRDIRKRGIHVRGIRHEVDKCKIK